MNAILAHADPGSFRDCAGKIYRVDDRIFRTVSSAGVAAFNMVWESGVLQKMSAQGRLIDTTLLPPFDPIYKMLDPEAAYILSHPTLPIITYPYEWSFNALKSAAISHLDLHLALLDEGFTLSDASAFNMQFNGAQPLHIDTLSVIPYKEGMRWDGYRQFLHQFFNPLVLESKTGVSFGPFFRATLDGITSAELLRLLPRYTLLKLGFVLHILAPAWGEHSFYTRKATSTSSLKGLPKERYRGLLHHLRNITEMLKPPTGRKTEWFHYSLTTSYSTSETQIKQQALKSFIQSHCPAMLLDIGCNKGEYATLALEFGARRVVGIDVDRPSVNAAFTSSALNKLRFTPLVIDIANPSPAQGWRNKERGSLTDRIKADAVIALALVHHLCIGRNIPLSEVIEFIVSLAPHGLIEFVPKSDPQVVELLRFRQDVFQDYTYKAVKAYLSKCAHIVAETNISGDGRVLFQFER